MILHCKPSVDYRYSKNRNQIEHLRTQNVQKSIRDILKTLDVNQNYPSLKMSKWTSWKVLQIPGNNQIFNLSLLLKNFQ